MPRLSSRHDEHLMRAAVGVWERVRERRALLQPLDGDDGGQIPRRKALPAVQVEHVAAARLAAAALDRVGQPPAADADFDLRESHGSLVAS